MNQLDAVRVYILNNCLDPEESSWAHNVTVYQESWCSCPKRRLNNSVLLQLQNK
jgi:hypothetical protein